MSEFVSQRSVVLKFDSVSSLSQGPFTNYITSKGGGKGFSLWSRVGHGERGKLRFDHVTKLCFGILYFLILIYSIGSWEE